MSKKKKRSTRKAGYGWLSGYKGEKCGNGKMDRAKRELRKQASTMDFRKIDVSDEKYVHGGE